MIFTKTIRLWARDFYDVIVYEASLPHRQKSRLICILIMNDLLFRHFCELPTFSMVLRLITSSRGLIFAGCDSTQYFHCMFITLYIYYYICPGDQYVVIIQWGGRTLTKKKKYLEVYSVVANNSFTPRVKPWVNKCGCNFLDESLMCDHSNESYWAVLSCGIVCFWQFRKMNFEFFPSFRT